MRFWLMSKKNICMDDEDIRVILKEDLDTTHITRATNMPGYKHIGWVVSSPPFVLIELKIKSRL